MAAHDGLEKVAGEGLQEGWRRLEKVALNRYEKQEEERKNRFFFGK